ncbi:MAG TPA: serine/threonine-protein kinase, partial [Gemmataceae bacterium]|nr:serine/threonine-protein kinase [Gemmataceae bacterium]
KIRALEFFARVWTPPADADAPVRIGRHLIEGVIDAGGMGVVYRGYDPVLKREAAVKVIKRERLATAPAQALARFAREVEVLAKLSHPNVVPVYEADTHDGSPFMAMEYLPGGTLADARDALAARGPAAVAAVVEKVARAVQFSHDRGIFHRDLKPENVLLTDKGEPKVADFGLAKLLTAEVPAGDEADTRCDEAEARGRTTVGGRQPGTRAYMAPELRNPDLGPAPAGDVWALGVILHELLTGRPPTPDKSPVPAEVAKKVPGRTGRRLQKVVARCLRPNPLTRYATAGEVADALAAESTRPRRRVAVWALAVVALVGLAAAASSIDWAEWRYQERVAEIRNRLDRNETVSIVGPGEPRPLYRVEGNPLLTNVRWGNEGLRVETPGDCSLVELFSAPVGTHLRVEVVVQVNRALTVKNAWGVFLTRDTGGGGAKGYNFDWAGFHEPMDRREPLRAHLGQYHIRSPGWGDEPEFAHMHQTNTSSVTPPEELDPPREIVVSLRDTVAARCGYAGQVRLPPEFGPIPDDHRWQFRHDVQTRFRVSLAGRDGPSVRIGLFVRHCAVTVHRFTVSLIPPS